jgi:hypothetical protein
MKPLVGRVLVAIALFAAATIAARESRKLRNEAETHERLATLRYAEVDDSVGGYWRGEYERLQNAGSTTPGDADSDTMLLRANAAFRASRQVKQTREEHMRQLDAVLQAYADVLKSPAFLPDAAFNYEYVARLRDGLGRPRAMALAPMPVARSAGDLPGGPTIHGRPGGPPPSTKGEDFEILTPMEYGDRETQPEPTSGVKPVRKG